MLVHVRLCVYGLVCMEVVCLCAWVCAFVPVEAVQYSCVCISLCMGVVCVYLGVHICPCGVWLCVCRLFGVIAHAHTCMCSAHAEAV